jgi:hypothetical protein
MSANLFYNHKTNQTASVPLEEPSPKKVKTGVSSTAEGLPDKASIYVEYAKGVFVSAFRHFCGLAFERSKSSMVSKARS